MCILTAQCGLSETLLGDPQQKQSTQINDQIVFTLMVDPAFGPGMSPILQALKQKRASDTQDTFQVEVQTRSSNQIVHDIKEHKVADFITLGDPLQMQQLVIAGLVDDSWNQDAYRGLPATSKIAFLVRKHNPKHITGWDDLLHPGVHVLTLDPRTSVTGKWAWMAAYTATSREGVHGNNHDSVSGTSFLRKLMTQHQTTFPETLEEAQQLFTDPSNTKLQGNTSPQGDSSSESSNGQVTLVPDVLILTEQQAKGITAQQPQFEVVVPETTMEVQYPCAVPLSAGHTKDAVELKNYLYTENAQRILAQQGFWPVDPRIQKEFAAKFQQPRKLFSVVDVEKWAEIEAELFDAHNGLIAQLYPQQQP